MTRCPKGHPPICNPEFRELPETKALLEKLIASANEWGLVLAEADRRIGELHPGLVPVIPIIMHRYLHFKSDGSYELLTAIADRAEWNSEFYFDLPLKESDVEKIKELCARRKWDLPLVHGMGRLPCGCEM